jgi:hypothetical protein
MLFYPHLSLLQAPHPSLTYHHLSSPLIFMPLLMLLALLQWAEEDLGSY